jgi:hypothetical protein
MKARQRRVRARRCMLVGVLTLLAGACSGDDSSPSSSAPDTVGAPMTAPTATSTAAPTTAPPTTSAPSSTTTGSPLPAATPADQATVAAITAALGPDGAGCDPLAPRSCYLPFPSDAYTADDDSTATGRRIAFATASLPANASGVHIDAAEWNRNDGFSINSSILAAVDGADLAGSALPSWTDLDESLAPDASVVIVDAETGGRVPLWAAPDGGAIADPLLVIHPAIALEPARGYVVAVRGLAGSAGPAEPSAAFRAYRDNLTTDLAPFEGRRPAMEAAFELLAAAGVERADLQLAWTFTTASAESTTGRMTHIRDQALLALGDASPEFTVAAVTPNPREGVAFSISGTYTVPNYLTGRGAPGSAFSYAVDALTDPDALPAVNPGAPTLQSPFLCNVPQATVDGAAPARLAQYGHGLLGSNDEIDASNVRTFAASANIVFCATNWAGMSEEDIPNAVAALGDLSTFRTMVDRLQQGVLNQIFLGRFMLAADGLASIPELHRADGSPMVDASRLVYDGNSQGGIMGLMLTAVSPDIERSVLGVPGMNYSLLLSRSVDWETYEAFLVPAYPDEVDRRFILSLLQMLWDRGEGGGYVHEVDVPVLMHVAFGDHQVSELAAFVEARTLGLPIHRPVTDPGRSQEAEPGWGLKTLEYPATGGGIVMWDSGIAPIPVTDTAPTGPHDSHEDPRASPDAQRQKAAFLFDGQLIDVCNAQPCKAAQVD